MDNTEFFSMLYEDDGFCKQLGRTTLAAGRLESNLKQYLHVRGVTVREKAPLGEIIKQLRKGQFISDNGKAVLNTLAWQRTGGPGL
ncbi:MAG: hypothetical protein V1897_06365 [Pseudomonadota bacterium]